MPERITLRHGDVDYFVEPLDHATVRLEGHTVAAPRRASALAAGEERWVFLDGETYVFRVERGARRRPGGHHDLLSAPMPATVIRVNVTPGEHVKGGDTLIVLEAMKMELPVRAAADGIVKAVHCRAGELVPPGVTLVDLET